MLPVFLIEQDKELLTKAKNLTKQADKLRVGIRAAEENTWRSFTVSCGLSDLRAGMGQVPETMLYRMHYFKLCA